MLIKTSRFEARELRQILAVRPPCLFPRDSTLVAIARAPRSVTSDIQHNVSNEIFAWCAASLYSLRTGDQSSFS